LARRVGAAPRELSAPVRVTGGYYLLLVVDRRNGTSGGGEQDTVYDIVQVVFPLPARPGEAIRQAALREAASIRGAAKDCPSLLKIGKEKAPQLSSEGQLRANNISPQMRALVKPAGDRAGVGADRPERTASASSWCARKRMGRGCLVTATM